LFWDPGVFDESPGPAIQGCGHIAHEEDPVTFADHVARSFASGVAADGDSVDSVDAG